VESADEFKYGRAVTELRRRIERGAYTSGELPPVAGIAAELGISIGTVRRALMELDRVGLTGTRRGRPRMVLRGSDTASVTRYERVAEAIRRDMEQGVLAPGTQMPGELDLAVRFDVSRATVRQALGVLERAGHVERRAGRRYVPGAAESSDLAYERVAAQIRAEIRANKYPADGKLPGEHRLSDDFSVSRPTIRQALQLLESEGAVRSVPKQGWYVAGSRER
jgi:DNA-binding GntR family transcriptional regulator